MEIGDVVRYKQEFLSPHTGTGYPFADIADRCGEIIEIRWDGKVARIRWDDETESSSLARNVERADFIPSPTPVRLLQKQQFEQRVERSQALLELTEDFFQPEGYKLFTECLANYE